MLSAYISIGKSLLQEDQFKKFGNCHKPPIKARRNRVASLYSNLREGMMHLQANRTSSMITDHEEQQFSKFLVLCAPETIKINAWTL
jgi:hypothetical protein